jgi:hypothetical protein
VSVPRTGAGKRLLAALPNEFPSQEWWLVWLAAIEAEAIEQVRARLVAGVEELAEDDRHAFSPAYLHGHADALTAVIARIGSIATDGSECPLCGGVGRIFDITEDVNRALGEGKLLLSPLLRDTEGGTE